MYHECSQSAIHDFGANSHLIETGRADACTSGRVPSNVRVAPFGWQEWLRVRRDPYKNQLTSLL